MFKVRLLRTSHPTLNSQVYVGTLKPDDPKRAVGRITIAYDEEAQGKTLNDLSEEEMDELIDVFMLDTPTATVTKGETGKGTKILIFDSDCYDIMTIWKGYQVALRLIPNGKLTEEQKKMALEFLTDVTIE